ncbi:proline-rich protein HaeIII subfamily 1-like [Vulpes lagopus]|uniref:proline-rich protein HaeIII subfamily 1-like n=1 Tax=Vulpes lagopus TaxID=494514 RepID=UPI001BC9BBF2|nr:proline-rich protein HaeIII subfamily 1-like [Vulpes lagopus]
MPGVVVRALLRRLCVSWRAAPRYRTLPLGPRKFRFCPAVDPRAPENLAPGAADHLLPSASPPLSPGPPRTPPEPGRPGRHLEPGLKQSLGPGLPPAISEEGRPPKHQPQDLRRPRGAPGGSLRRSLGPSRHRSRCLRALPGRPLTVRGRGRPDLRIPRCRPAGDSVPIPGRLQALAHSLYLAPQISGQPPPPPPPPPPPQ